MVFTHRPLFDLYPDWDWRTGDAAKVTDMLAPYKDVQVFYGHIHQQNIHAAGSDDAIRRAGPDVPAAGAGLTSKESPNALGFNAAIPRPRVQGRSRCRPHLPALSCTEYAADRMTPVVTIIAKKFAFMPNQVTLQHGATDYHRADVA